MLFAEIPTANLFENFAMCRISFEASVVRNAWEYPPPERVMNEPTSFNVQQLLGGAAVGHA